MSCVGEDVKVINLLDIRLIMATKLILLCGLIFSTLSTLHVSEDWLERGFDVKDNIFQSFNDYNLQVETKCSDVSLTPSSTYGYNGTILSGYLKVGKGNSALGFIFYGKENVEKSKINTIPTVLWLNGGPGSSSQLGNLMELGPFWVVKSNKQPYDIEKNKYAWTKDFNILFVDQPVGTGLSYADPNFSKSYCTSMGEVAIDFYNALKELYTNPNGCFSQLGIKGNHPLIIFGESYAGKYAPAIAEKILREAKDNQGFLTGLKGLGVGDGFTDPVAILAQMGEFAYNLGLLDYQERAKIEQILLNATYQFRSSEWKDLHNSFEKVLGLIKTSTGGVNVYDITKYEPYPTALLDEYFNNPNTISMYKLDPNIKYNSQGANVYEALFEDFMKNEVQLVQKILMYYNIKVLIYTGQNDLIVDTPGTFRWVERLTYEHSQKFRDTLFKTWKVANKIAGYTKQVGNLELRTINNAGHLVPMDQGQAALQMLKEFVAKSLTENVQAQDVK